MLKIKQYLFLLLARFVCIFISCGNENNGFAPSSRREQQSPGLLHLHHDQDGTIKKVYDELRLIGACHKVSYPTIKKWFLETYPEIVEFGIDDAA